MEIGTKVKMFLSVVFIGLAFFVLMMGKVYAQSNYPKPMTSVYSFEDK